MGGLARRAGFVGAERRRVPTLLVDAGDFANLDSTDAPAWNAFLFPRLVRMGYDAIAPGERECLRGAAYVRSLLDTFALPLVSAALVDPGTGRFLLPRVRWFDRAGARIAVTAVLSDSLANAIPIETGIAALDSRTALEGALEEIGGKADVVVLLAHTGPAEARALLAEHPRVGLCVVGHNIHATWYAAELGDWYVLEVGEQGAFLGGVEVALGPDGRILSRWFRTTQLTKAVPADSALGFEVQEFLEAREIPVAARGR
jgi:2',3'-cyclic-nucleotide 2'-phosphodiesterase (5'-nucleotidase family)